MAKNNKVIILCSFQAWQRLGDRGRHKVLQLTIFMNILTLLIRVEHQRKFFKICYRTYSEYGCTVASSVWNSPKDEDNTYFFLVPGQQGSLVLWQSLGRKRFIKKFKLLRHVEIFKFKISRYVASTILPNHSPQPLPEMPPPAVLGDKVQKIHVYKVDGGP